MGQVVSSKISGRAASKRLLPLTTMVGLGVWMATSVGGTLPCTTGIGAIGQVVRGCWYLRWTRRLSSRCWSRLY